MARKSSSSLLSSSTLLELASAFRRMRLKRGLSQMALADLTGRKQARISLVESGRDDPRFSTLAALAKALGSELMLIPREHADEVRRIIDSPSGEREQARSLFDEMYIPDPEEEAD